MLALVTCDEAVAVDTDLPLLRAALPDASIVSWHDPTVDWAAFDAVVIRSAWDYHRHLDRFRAWATHVDEVTTLRNPLALIDWNLDKRYLAEIAGRGVPIVPTTFLDDVVAVDRFAEAGGFAGDLVLKPSIGASASGVLATHGDERAAIEHALSLSLAGRAVMVQPRLPSATTEGETGLVYLGGVFSHAFRRRVVLPAETRLDPDVAGDERDEPANATSAELAVGDVVMAGLASPTYARIDLLGTDDGPVVLEVELVEPSLFLHLDDGAPARAATAFRNLIS